MTTFSQMVADQGFDLADDTPVEVPETAVETTETVGDGGEGVTEETPETPVAGAVDNFTAVDPSSLAPELQAIYKSFQADYTRKMQALAEQRRGLEGDQDVTTVRALKELARTDPEAAARWLQDQAALLAQANTDNQGYDVDPELLTDNERALYERLQGLEQKLVAAEGKLQSYEPTITEAQYRAGEAQLNSAFMEIEKQVLGRDLTEADKESISDLALRMGVKDLDGLKAAAKAWDYDNALKRGRDQASQSVPKKEAMSPAGKSVGQVGGGGASKGGSIRDLWGRAEKGSL